MGEVADVDDVIACVCGFAGRVGAAMVDAPWNLAGIKMSRPCGDCGNYFIVAIHISKAVCTGKGEVTLRELCFLIIFIFFDSIQSMPQCF